MILKREDPNRTFSSGETEDLVKKTLSKYNFDGKRLLAIIPDSTRTAPVDLLFKTFCQILSGRVKKLDFLIATGTHPPMSEETINDYLKVSTEQRKNRYKDVGIFNHHWDRSEELVHIGTISREEMNQISGGLLNEEIPVTVNKRIFDYDQLLIAGPVFPHEVVGFSGGYKYLFPGISGPQLTHSFHWLSALITNPKINGTKQTPPRAVLNKAASFIKTPMIAFAFVMKGKGLCGFYAGEPKETWSAAADLSSKVNVVYKDQSFHTVLSVVSKMYEEVWTAGKGMYKVEPVVKDGGKVIIYGPHIKEISRTHGNFIRQIGYHTRDYFLAQMGKFKGIPGAILAHSTHVKGIGTYKNGQENPRIDVILATGIPQSTCREINLGYINPEEIDPEDYAGRENEGILLVKRAGEVLYRLSDGTVPDVDELY